MKIIFAIVFWLTGVVFGFALAAWTLYDPIIIGPAKYTWNRSSSAVPPYTVDGSKKLFTITCISESEKDCPQATTVPEPGTVVLMAMGLIIGFFRYK